MLQNNLSSTCQKSKLWNCFLRVITFFFGKKQFKNSACWHLMDGLRRSPQKGSLQTVPKGGLPLHWVFLSNTWICTSLFLQCVSLKESRTRTAPMWDSCMIWYRQKLVQTPKTKRVTTTVFNPSFCCRCTIANTGSKSSKAARPAISLQRCSDLRSSAWKKMHKDQCRLPDPICATSLDRFLNTEAYLVPYCFQMVSIWKPVKKGFLQHIGKENRGILVGNRFKSYSVSEN